MTHVLFIHISCHWLLIIYQWSCCPDIDILAIPLGILMSFLIIYFIFGKLMTFNVPAEYTTSDRKTQRLVWVSVLTELDVIIQYKMKGND